MSGPTTACGPALELRGIERAFGEVKALDGARLALSRGEIHALLGENGAGKTTLVGVACGLVTKDAGQVLVDGVERSFRAPRDAVKAGLALVPQHDLLVEAATVADNLARLDPAAPFLESARARRERVRRTAATLSLELGEPDARVRDLAVGTRQRLEIAGALLADPTILILDEPTAVLSPDETAALFHALRERARSGRSILLITHRLSETFAVADRVTVLSRGRTVLESITSGTTPEAVAALLVAGGEGYVPAAPATAAALESRSDSVSGVLAAAVALACVDLAPRGGPPASFQVEERGLLTLLAIDGNGADTLAAAVAGIVPATGSLSVAGQRVPLGEPRAFRAAGGGFIPGDRRREGVFADLTLAENLALQARKAEEPAIWLDRARIHEEAAELLARFGVRARGPEARARELSGGNQQKLVLARELSRSPRALVAIHPTRGLDVGAAADIHRRLLAARDAGCALLVVTADPEEASALGGTIRVVYRGRLSNELPASTPFEVLGRHMGGLAA